MHEVTRPPVAVTSTLREESLLAGLGARRFVVEASGEYVYFGTTTAQVCPGACASSGASQPLVSKSIADQYWRTEASFTYRLLRTVSEFGIRGGVYRGTSVVPNEADATVEVTTMPHAASAGVRLLMDLTLSLDHGFSITAHGGYQARNFDSGGPATGAGVGYAF
jgi:hypothetical protein